MAKNYDKIFLYQSPVFLFTILTVSIGIIEMLVMFILPLIIHRPYPFSSGIGIFFDCFTLSILLFPITYFFMLRPLKLHLGEQEKAKKNWQATFDGIKDPLYVHDRQLRIIRANKAYKDASGMPFNEIIGKLYYEVFPKMDSPFKMCSKALELQEEEEEEVSLPSIDKIFKVRVYPVKSDNKKYHYSSVHILEDITEKKKSELEHKTILSTAIDGFWLADTQGRILDVNNAYCQMTGYSREEILTMSVPDIEAVEIPEETAHRIQRIIKTSWDRFESRHRCKDGKIIDVEVSVNYLRIEGERFFAFIRDITERKRLGDELRHSMQSLKKTLNGTINAIALLGEMRDPYTSGHEMRVAQLACAIAKEIGMTEDQIEGIRVSAFLHDIGKIAIPAEILSKPSKLSDNEFGIIRTHSLAGFDILKMIEFPWPVAQTILQHHERLNGSGYPSGLKGDEITLEARILAVADVIEAMACHRPYRPALGIDKALEEISRHKDVLYDAKVVDACLRLFKDRKFEFNK